MELEEVDDMILDQLAACIGTFFFVYPHLHESKRRAHYKAISRLFIALYPKGVALQRLLQRIGMSSLFSLCLFVCNILSSLCCCTFNLLLKVLVLCSV
jgi:hypothetical protein